MRLTWDGMRAGCSKGSSRPPSNRSAATSADICTTIIHRCIYQRCCCIHCCCIRHCCYCIHCCCNRCCCLLHPGQGTTTPLPWALHLLAATASTCCYCIHLLLLHPLAATASTSTAATASTSTAAAPSSTHSLHCRTKTLTGRKHCLSCSYLQTLGATLQTLGGGALP